MLPNKRPHLNGSCCLCYAIKEGRLPRGDPLEIVHRAIIVFCALPTDKSSWTLLVRLDNLSIGEDYPDYFLFLFKEVLEVLHPRNAELERVQALIPDDIYPGEGRMVTETKGAARARVKELVEVVRTSLVRAMKGRLGLLAPGQHNGAVPDQPVLRAVPQRRRPSMHLGLGMMSVLPPPKETASSKTPKPHDWEEGESERLMQPAGCPLQKTSSEAGRNKRQRKRAASSEPDAAEGGPSNRPDLGNSAVREEAGRDEAES